jgi:hypothetical protein
MVLSEVAAAGQVRPSGQIDATSNLLLTAAVEADMGNVGC